MPTFDPPRNAFHRALRQRNEAIGQVAQKLALAEDIQAQLLQSNARVAQMEQFLITTNELARNVQAAAIGLAESVRAAESDIIATNGLIRNVEAFAVGLADRVSIAEIDIKKLQHPRDDRPDRKRRPQTQAKQK